ncbi:uncharacterized protein LOC124455772 [Xenia sp. Carnegie-2017]|uniref:uncharacterized protein LOC124455772 n=1 Tax=Xenia sp. Carnegie-2017 TaxID=2897299 RepID=UPI001F04A4C0|nr:uncharacterized protein LOC124455772 [Xenia sp. Carnegie-2017]
MFCSKIELFYLEDPSYFRNRLALLQKKYGDIRAKEPEKTMHPDPIAVKKTPEGLETVDNNLILTSIPKPQSADMEASNERSGESSTDLSELRKRLEKIKKKAL